MISLSDEAQSVLTRSYRVTAIAVESWLGSEVLSDAVPVITGTEEVNRSDRVPERLTLTVPRRHRGESWSPVEDDHPLAANGQRLRVQLGIGTGNRRVEWIQRGWFVVMNSFASGDTVQVEAMGLLQLIHEARLVSPYQPSGTLVSTLRGLVEPALTVVVDPALQDRSVPSGINYDEDRLDAFKEIMDALGADAWVTEEGYLYATPMGPSLTPALTLTNGEGGTVIDATGTSTRDGAYNLVVARGTASDGATVQGVAYDFDGPKRYGGPLNPLPVPYFFQSPLLTTNAQAFTAAQTVLSRLKRSTSKEFEVEMVPHPGLQAGDTIDITTDDYAGLAVVESLTLPYTPDGRPQTLKVRALT